MRKVMSLGLALSMVALATVMPAKADNGDANARRQYAKVMITKGQTVKAAQQMQYVLASGNGTTEDYTILGEALRYSADFRGAIEAYTNALRLTPMNMQALSGLAMSYAQAGQYGRGISIIRTGLSQTVDPASRQYLSATLASIRNMSTIASAPTSGPIAQ